MSEKDRVSGSAATELRAGVRDNKQARQRIASPGRYTPLVPRPEGGADQIMVAHDLVPASPPRRDAPTSVYRYYDERGLLLYVGITNRGITRNSEHNKTKEWWQFVGSQNVEHFSDRDSALLREKQLIRKFRPPFNVQHNPDHEQTRAVYLASRSAVGRGGRMPKIIECKLIDHVGRGPQPLYRSIAPLPRAFYTKAPARLTARMVGSSHRLSRVTKVREKGSFLLLQLLRDDPKLGIAEVHVKWEVKDGPWLMTILSVAVRAKAGQPHEFVDDPASHGYCIACALPKANRRHCERAA